MNFHSISKPLMAAATLCLPSIAGALTVTPSTTEGPYYTMSSSNTVLTNTSTYGSAHLLTTEGTDNDMIHIYSSSTQSTGTVTAVSGTVVNTSGTVISGAVVELWVADNNGIYWYVSSSSGTNNYANRDKNFQGYGKCTTDSSGAWSFLTIKPGLYTGRIRHYHLKVRINGTEYLTTQLMPADEAAASPSDNVVASLGSNLSRCTYTPTTGTITWGSSTYTGNLITGRQLVINYTPAVTPATAPTITTQPSAVSVVTEGSAVSFSIAATGNGTLSYQWYKDSSSISGATSSTYSIASAAISDVGSYYCVVTNTLNSTTASTTSSTVSLTVSPDYTGINSFGTFLSYYDISSSSATDDNDGDGIPNILEFIFGGNPLTTDTGTAPTSEYRTVNGSAVLVYSFYAVNDLGGVTWSVEYNSDLPNNWTTAVAGTDGVTVATEATTTEGLNHVTVTIPWSGSKVFARLRAKLPSE